MSYPTLSAWQYRVGKDPSPGSIAFGEYQIALGAGINLTEVSDCNGTRVGWLIGFPLDLDKRCVVSGKLSVDAEFSGDADVFAQAVLKTLAGRFVWAACLGDRLRLYTDSSALVPCVFDPQERIAGSTSSAILTETDYKKRFDHKAYSRFDIAGQGWFPGGLTAHMGIERVLANHYLDLKSWTVHRHWPLSDIAATDDPAAAVQEMTDLIRQQIEILIGGEKKVAISLTAGRDTRILLACARPFIDKIAFTTVVGEDSHSCDTIMARKISAAFGLEHIELPRKRASKEQHDLYMRRGGHCIGDSNSWYFPSVEPIADDYVMIGGAGGEAGRAFYWRDSDDAATSLTGEALAGRMGFWGEDRLNARLSDWLSGTGQANALINLDLAYVEHRMGPWGAAQMCNDPTLVRFAPLITRRMTELLLSLPDDWKRRQNLADEIVQTAWPELARFPYNSLGMVKDNMILIQKAAKNPLLVVRKFRKFLGR